MRVTAPPSRPASPSNLYLRTFCHTLVQNWGGGVSVHLYNLPGLVPVFSMQNNTKRGELGCAHLFNSDWVVRNFLRRVVLCATFLDGLCCPKCFPKSFPWCCPKCFKKGKAALEKVLRRQEAELLNERSHCCEEHTIER